MAKKSHADIKRAASITVTVITGFSLFLLEQCLHLFECGLCFTRLHWLPGENSNILLGTGAAIAGVVVFCTDEFVILSDLMVHIIYFKILLQEHSLRCSSTFKGLSIMFCSRAFRVELRAEILSIDTTYALR